MPGEARDGRAPRPGLPGLTGMETLPLVLLVGGNVLLAILIPLLV